MLTVLRFTGEGLREALLLAANGGVEPLFLPSSPPPGRVAVYLDSDGGMGVAGSEGPPEYAQPNRIWFCQVLPRSLHAFTTPLEACPRGPVV